METTGMKLTKLCTKCGINKPLTEFNKRKEAKDGHRASCKSCRNKKNRELYVKQDKASKTRALKQHKKVILIKYKGSKCNLCGIEYDGTNGCIFDFHHISEDKRFTIGKNMSKRLIELQTEVDKCILICSNCHRREHSEKY